MIKFEADKSLKERIEIFLNHTNREFSVNIINENLLIILDENSHTIAVCTNNTFICTDIKYQSRFEILSDDFLDLVYNAEYNFICTDYCNDEKVESVCLFN